MGFASDADLEQETLEARMDGRTILSPVVESDITFDEEKTPGMVEGTVVREVNGVPQTFSASFNAGDDARMDIVDDINKQIRSWNANELERYLGTQRDLIKERYNAFVAEHGEEPLYAEVTIRFKDDGESHLDMIKLSSDADPRDDDKIFFYVDSLRDLQNLVQPDNGEDFDLIGIQNIEFYDKSLYLGEEESKSSQLSPEEMKWFDDHLARVKDALRSNKEDGGLLTHEVSGLLTDADRMDAGNVRNYFKTLFENINSGDKPALRDEFNKLSDLSNGSFRQMAWAIAYKMSDEQIRMIAFDQILDDNKDVLERLKNNPVNHETVEKPYRISIGTDDRPGGVEGEFHVQFVKEINAVSFKEIQSLAEELGGSARIMNNQEWADFYDESSAVKFAEKVIALNADRIVASRDNARSDANNQYDAKDDAGTMQIGVEGGSLGQRIGDG